MTSQDRARVCAKASYLSSLFQEKGISIDLEDILDKTEYVGSLDEVVDGVIRIYLDKFSSSEISELERISKADFLEGLDEPSFSDTDNSSLDLEEVCGRKDISFSYDNKNGSSFSMEVDARHQAEVDSLIALFANTGVNVKFELNSDHSFQLVVYNTNRLISEDSMVKMIASSLHNARNDVDYLDGLSNDIQNQQVDFMIEHPEVYDSYTHQKEKKNSFSEQGQVLTEAIDAVDNGLVVAADTFGNQTLIDNETGDVITDSYDNQEIEDLASLAGEEVSIQNIGEEASNVASDIISEDTDEVVDENVESDAMDFGYVSSEDALDVIDTYRQTLVDQGISGADIVLTADSGSVSIDVGKEGSGFQPIHMHCNSDECEELKDSLIASMDSDSMNKINEDNDYQFSSSDGSTLTIHSQIMQEANIVQFQQAPTYSQGNVKVYQKTSNMSEAAFTTSFLLLFLVVASLIFSLLTLLFL